MHVVDLYIKMYSQSFVSHSSAVATELFICGWWVALTAGKSFCNAIVEVVISKSNALSPGLSSQLNVIITSYWWVSFLLRAEAMF